VPEGEFGDYGDGVRKMPITEISERELLAANQPAVPARPCCAFSAISVTAFGQ
jgi:hypothetical protein